MGHFGHRSPGRYLFARLAGAKGTDVKDIVSAIVRLIIAPQDRTEVGEKAAPGQFPCSRRSADRDRTHVGQA